MNWDCVFMVYTIKKARRAGGSKREDALRGLRVA